MIRDKKNSAKTTGTAGLRAGVALGVLALAMPQATGAQETGAAPFLSVDIFAGVRHEDDDPGTSTTAALARLGVGYVTATDRQRLSFAASVTAEAGEDGFDWTDPSLDLSYAVFSRQTELAIDLSYASSDVDDADLDDDFDAGDLLGSTGTRDDYEARVTLVTGRAAPFGTETELRWLDTVYRDGAPDPDETTFGLTTTLRFTVDPRIEFRLIGDWEVTETDDALDTEETDRSLFLETELRIDRVWTAVFGVGYAETETRTTGGVTRVDGVEAAFLLTRDMGNGTLSFSIDREIFDDGPRDTVELRRDMALANGGTLGAGLGFTVFDDGEVTPLASLDYALEINRDAFFSLSLDHSGSIDDAGDRIQRTSVSSSFRQNITDASSWSVDATLASVENENPLSADVQRVDLGLAYFHALSSDWNFVARATHEVVYEEGAPDDRSNVLSLGLERSFVIRP